MTNYYPTEMQQPVPYRGSRYVMRRIALIANTVFVLIWLPAIFSIQLYKLFGSYSPDVTSGGWIGLSVLLFVWLLVPVMGFNLAYLIYWIRTRKRDVYLRFSKISTVFLIAVPSLTICAVTIWIILSIILMQAYEHMIQTQTGVSP